MTPQAKRDACKTSSEHMTLLSDVRRVPISQLSFISEAWDQVGLPLSSPPLTSSNPEIRVSVWLPVEARVFLSSG